VSRFRRPATVAGFAIGLAGLSAVATGCSLAAPTPITSPYSASDGANAQLATPDGGTVKFLNFLLVSAAKGKPGVLVGAVTTDGGDPVRVQLSVLDAAGQNAIGQVNLTATPGQLTQVGPGGTTTLQVSSVPQPPGAVLKLHAQTPEGGTDFELPVLAPQNAYSTITPTESAAPSPSVSESSSVSPSASESSSASPAASDSSSVSPSASSS
jgi:hypothetical protein